MRIKEWEKYYEWINLIVYRNKKKNTYLRISRQGVFHDKWVYSQKWIVSYGKIRPDGSLGMKEWSKVFDTEQEAMSFAITWMKNHPNG